MDTHENANTDDGIQIRKVACDRILRRIEQGNGKRAYQDRHIEIRDPGWKFFESVSVWTHPKEAASESPLPKYRKKTVTHTAFVREPHLALNPHGRRSLLRHPKVWRRGADRVVVPHARHLAVLLRRLDVRNLVRTGVARRAAGLFGELGERRGGEGREEIRHGVPGATDDRAVVRAGAGADAGGSRETGHGGGKERTAGVGAVGLMAG